MPRKVAIVGKATNTRRQAPFHDPEWEIWGLGWDDLSRMDRIYEIHEPQMWPLYFVKEAGGKRMIHDAERYAEYLRSVDVPLYMKEDYPDFPAGIRYPMEEVSALTGKYLQSSIAYMLAHAILEEVPTVGIWGVNMGTEGEYAYQRPNLEYLIGFARGRGMSVYIPPGSALLTGYKPGEYGLLYGHHLLTGKQATDEQYAQILAEARGVQDMNDAPQHVR